MSTAPPPQAASSAFAAASISGHPDTRTAAVEVAGEIHDRVGPGCDLVVLFASFHHRAALPEAAETVRRTTSPQTLLAVTAEAVLGVDQERDGQSGLSALALKLPGMDLRGWSFKGERDGAVLRDPEAARAHLAGCGAAGAPGEIRAVLVFADPFSTPITRLLPALAGCRDSGDPVAVVGGMCSGASQPGQNVLIHDDQVLRAGAVGATIGGPIDVGIVLSQGCRPIGRPLLVTKCKGNMILELGGAKALEALQEQVAGLSEKERELMSRGVLLGTVIDEYKDRFGRGDFLVRNILGFDRANHAIAVGDVPRVGQTVQFHVRDAETAHEDLQLLLDAQELREKPAGGMLFTCNGRGSRLFKDRPNDVQTIRQRLGDIPLAGFFAAGEIGPIGARSFVHGHTAVLALFRSRGA